MFKAIIFDWDGTLCNSIDRIVASVEVVIAGAGLPPKSKEQIKGIIGLGIPEAMMVLYPDWFDQKLAASFQTTYVQHYQKLDKKSTPLFHGALNMLQQLKRQGYMLAVATGKYRVGLEIALRDVGLEEFFDVTRCADEALSKPNPLMLHQILDEMQVPPNQAIMVGDAVFDLEMARLAGMPSVAVSYGAQALAHLLPYEPAFYIDNVAELPPKLELWTKSLGPLGDNANVG